MKDSLVSVVIPVYDAARYIRESLNSILEQDHKNLEILVCDDASVDQSLAVLESFSDSRIRLLKNDENVGYLRTINLLVSKASGDFICFQDADDVSHRERIKIQLDELARKPSLGFVGTNYRIINPQGKVVLEKNVETDHQTLKRMLEIGNPFQKPSILFRREVYDSIGMFREEFLSFGNISEDFDWILRASEYFDVGNVNHETPLYSYRSVPTAMSKDIAHVSQLFGHAVALKLYHERRSGQRDSIQRGDLQAIDDFIRDLKQPYDRDKSLFHQKLASSLIYAGLNFDAIKHAFAAVVKEPRQWANYRLLQYCIRKTLIRF